MLKYKRFGNGPTLVMIHGFLGSIEIFNEVNDILKDHFDIVTVELPGHGGSAVTKQPFTVEIYAKQIAEVLKNEEITSCHLLGHSMGGYIAFAAIQHKIISADSLILANSSQKADKQEAKEKRRAQQQLIKEKGVPHFVDQVIANFVAPDASPEILKNAKDIALQGSVDGYVGALEAMIKRADQTQLLEDLHIPVLVIEGTEDKVVPSITTNNPTVIKASTQSGHLSMIEDPQGFANAVRSFILEK